MILEKAAAKNLSHNLELKYRVLKHKGHLQIQEKFLKKKVLIKIQK